MLPSFSTRGFTNAYIAALAVIAVLAVGGYWVLARSTEEQAGYARIINVAARERTLVQRIVFLASELIVSEELQRTELRSQLRAAADELANVRSWLRANPTAAAIDPGGRAGLDEAVSTFVAHARALAEAPEEALLPTQPDLATIRQYGPAALINDLDALVRAYEAASQAASVRLLGLETAIILLILLALAAEALLVFRPIIRQLEAETRELAMLSLVASRTNNAVIITDAAERIEWVNDSFTQITGYTAEEAAGRKPGELLQGQDTDRRTAGEIGEAIRRGVPYNGEILNYTKGGAPYWIAMQITPVHDEQGRLARFIAIETNVTARKEMEHTLRAALKETSDMTSALYRAAIVAVTDRRGIILDANDQFCAISGYSKDELIGKDHRIVSSGYHPREYIRELWSTIGRGDIWHGEFCNRAKDGHLYWVDSTIVPFLDGRGRPERYLAIRFDITERKNVERLKSEFISVVSHELRTPLTSIRGALGLISGGVAGELPPTMRSMVDIAIKNSDRLIRLINDILDIEKIESGKMAFNMRTLALVPLVEQAIEGAQAFAHQLGVRLTLGAAERVEVGGDADRLVQVFTNLLSNAAKFSPAGEAVVVTVERRTDGMVRVGVTDRGPGIPEEFRSRIFQKFAQADSSNTRRQGGTGLGLSISKAIVERHGGTIAFDSEVGVGTTFYVDLPELHPALVAPGAPRILICAADRVAASLLADMLRGEGYECDIAADAAEARALLNTNVYAGLTMDVLLTQDENARLLSDLHGDARTRDLPVVVISARADPVHHELQGDAVALIGWLQQPVEREHLVSAITSATCRPAGEASVLHVEDDGDITEFIAMLLQGVAQVKRAASVAEARALLARQHFDLAILDLELPDGSGLELLPLLHRRQPATPVLIFSADDVGRTLRERVAAALVKARTSNQELLATIKALLGRRTEQPSHSA